MKDVSQLQPWTNQQIQNWLKIGQRIAIEKLSYTNYVFLSRIFDTFAGMFQLSPEIENWAWLKIQRYFFKFAYQRPKIWVRYNSKFDEYTIYDEVEPGTYNNLLTNQRIKIPQDDLVTFEWDTDTNRFLMWVKLAQEIETLETIFKNNAILDSKKIIRNVYNRDEYINEEEIKDILDPNKPFIDVRVIESAKKGGAPNQLDTLDVGVSTSQLSLSNLIDWWNWKANMLGWVTVQDQKLERKTYSEGQIDVNNTILLQQLTLTNLRVFAHDIKQKWPSQDLKFVLTNPINSESLKSNQPDQTEYNYEYQNSKPVDF